MPHADVNGQRLFYEDSGGDGAAVLFSHGYLMDHTMFDAQVDALAPEFRCIRWDERGFGATEYDGKPFTDWDSAADAVGLLDHLGIESAVFGGMSQGGFLSLRAALSSPDRVRALILIDTSADVDDPETLSGYDQLEAAWTSPDTPDDVRAGIHETVAGLIIGDPSAAQPWLEKWRAAPLDSTLQPFNTLVSREDITDRLGEIACPALIVHGQDDAAIDLARAQALADALPHCRDVVIVPGAAHAANLTHPDVVNPPILAFLRSL